MASKSTFSIAVDDDIDPLGAEDLPEAHLDRLGLGSPAGDLVELGHEGMEGIPVDEGDLDLVSLRKCFSRILPAQTPP